MIRRVFRVTVVVLLWVLSLWAVWWLRTPPHWTEQDVEDTTVVPLPYTVETISDAYPFALLRARAWRPDAEFTDAMVTLIGPQVESGKGVAGYFFGLKNPDKEGLPYATALVEVDFKKKAIVKFHANSGFDLPITPHTSPVDLPIDERRALQIAEENGGREFRRNFAQPKVIIRYFGETWRVEYFPNPETYGVGDGVLVNARTGKVAAKSFTRFTQQ